MLTNIMCHSCVLPLVRVKLEMFYDFTHPKKKTGMKLLKFCVLPALLVSAGEGFYNKNM